MSYAENIPEPFVPDDVSHAPQNPLPLEQNPVTLTSEGRELMARVAGNTFTRSYVFSDARSMGAPDPEGVWHDTLEKIGRGNVVDPDNHIAFARTVARRIMIDDFRKRRTRPREVLSEEIADQHSKPSFEGNVVNQIVVQQILGQLTTNYATVLRLFYLEGYDTTQIATLLHMPPATVRSRLFRGLRIAKTKAEELDISSG